MSPTFLDPSLIPQSVESMYNHYSFNRALIRQMDVENEKFLTQWSTKFGIPKSRGPNFPAVIPQATDPRAAPARNGHVPQIQRPWSPSQARFGGMREPGGRLSVEQAPFKTASAVGRNGSDPTQNHAPISSREIKWCAPSLKQNDRHAPLERKLKKTDSPQSGKVSRVTLN